MSRLPSTQVSIAISLAIAIIGISLAVRYKDTATRSVGSKNLAIERLVETTLEKDDDGDGLKNWEETLYKTDINKKDTDGDGTNDGEEARLGRNPLISGTDASEGTGEVSSEFSYTATDRFSQEIFKEYINAKQSGKDITPDLSNRIAEAVLSQDYSDSEIVYKPEDMKILAVYSAAAVKMYGNSLGTILSAPPAANITEMDIFQKMTAESAASYQSELAALKKRYEEMQTKIVALSVPKELALPQANLANAISTFISAIDAVSAIEIDPIGALGKIDRYNVGLNLLQKSLLEIRLFLRTNEITFSSKESGYILVQ